MTTVPGRGARIGHIYPSGGIRDDEVQVMAPDGVQFVTTRVAFPDTSPEALLAMADGLAAAARLVADADVDLIAFNCTSAGILLGKDRIVRMIHEATGIAAITTSDAVEEAVAALGVERVALFTPYRAAVVEAEKAHFARLGVEVVVEAHLERMRPVDQGEIPADDWRRLAASVDTRDCDALLFSCGGIRLSPVVAAIEEDHRRPVISSNGALLWQALGRLNLRGDATRYGRLFACAHPAKASASQAV